MGAVIRDLIPGRAVRLLRAKAAELEADVKDTLRRDPHNTLAYLTADIALIADLLADQIERQEAQGTGPTGDIGALQPDASMTYVAASEVLDTTPRAAVVAAAQSHHPYTLDGLVDLDCHNGNCNHDDECPEVEMVVCAACYALVADSEYYPAEIRADRCPVCVAVTALAADEFRDDPRETLHTRTMSPTTADEVFKIASYIDASPQAQVSLGLRAPGEVDRLTGPNVIDVDRPRSTPDEVDEAQP